MATGLRERLQDLASDAPRADVVPSDLLPRARRQIVMRTVAVAAIVLLVVGLAVGAIRQLDRGSMPAQRVNNDVFSDLRGKIIYTTGNQQVEVIDPSNPGAPSTSIPLPPGWSPIGWSPDGQHILARIWTYTGADVGVVNANGTTERLTNDGAEFGGSFSPDGSSVVVPDRRGIRIIHLGTRESHFVVRNTQPWREGIFGSAWSPDGTTIAFIDRLWYRKGQRPVTIYSIEAVSPNGSNRVVLRVLVSHPYKTIEGPMWSPDGTRLCFVLGYAGKNNGAVFVMDADGGNLRKLTNQQDQTLFPTWSPDGTQIAYVGRRNLMVMAADGSDKRAIGQGGWSPVWTAPSPDLGSGP